MTKRNFIRTLAAAPLLTPDLRALVDDGRNQPAYDVARDEAFWAWATIRQAYRLNTPAQLERAGGVANVGVEGIALAALAKTRLNKHRIRTVGVGNEAVQGVRVTPNLCTSLAELDALVAALRGCY